MIRPPPTSALLPYPPLFRSAHSQAHTNHSLLHSRVAFNATEQNAQINHSRPPHTRARLTARPLGHSQADTFFCQWRRPIRRPIRITHCCTHALPSTQRNRTHKSIIPTRRTLFFFNDPSPSDICTPTLPAALPICPFAGPYESLTAALTRCLQRNGTERTNQSFAT